MATSLPSTRPREPEGLNALTLGFLFNHKNYQTIVHWNRITRLVPAVLSMGNSCLEGNVAQSSPGNSLYYQSWPVIGRIWSFIASLQVAERGWLPFSGVRFYLPFKA